MTDKEKIRKEVERLQKRAEHNFDISLTEIERQFWLGESNVLTLIGTYIDSMQEEPVSEGWIEELRTKLDSLSKEDFKKVFDKYAVDFNEEPVSEDLEEAEKEWLRPQLDKSYANYGEVKMMELTHFDGYAMLDAIEFGVKWQKEQMMAKAIDGDITFDYYGNDDKTYGCIAHNSFCLEDFGLKDRNKVKVIIIKED